MDNENRIGNHIILILFHPNSIQHNPENTSQEEKYILKYSPPNSPIQKKIIPNPSGKKPIQVGIETVSTNSCLFSHSKYNTMNGTR
jgi:hypothetical protein